jgi:hypothetical protein
VEIITLASRPDLAEALFAFPGAWPPFMYEDPTSDLYYDDAATAYPEFVMLAVEANRSSRAQSVFRSGGTAISRRSCRRAAGTG